MLLRVQAFRGTCHDDVILQSVYANGYCGASLSAIFSTAIVPYAHSTIALLPYSGEGLRAVQCISA